VAEPGDRFMACVFVVSEEPKEVEVYGFELTKSSMVEVGGLGEGWTRAAVKSRAAPRLEQYRLMREWLADPQSHAAAVQRAYDHIAANLDLVVPARESQLDGVELKRGIVYFTFGAKSDAAMSQIRDKSALSADRHLYRHIRPAVCGSDERAALLAFQENAPTFMYELNRRDGRPMTQFATFPNLAC